ncbi:hypothetical protein [Deinococcus sp. JMULE3]|uniref:dioxygenase family protein n=1 Tax=Deinococcus sp. JMULE3 TaxID=2518341 RepID=UPI0020C6AC5C|nr:hypothetical protein [Deinococcus sp. JMULE3]
MTQPIRPYPADDHDHHDDLNNLGLQADTNMLSRSVLDRRHVLGLGLLGIGLLASSRVNAATGAATGTSAACTPIPSETAGPYPADGSVASGQSLNVLTRSGVVRRDLRRSLGTGNVAPGVPLTLTLKLVNTNGSCAPLRGYAVYAWHCTADGNYSMYSSGVVGEDYLRGVQVSDAGGNVTFQTIVPGCYPGRWPTSTSRCTPPSPAPRTPAARSRRHSWPSRRPCASRRTPSPRTAAAPASSRRPA